ncbi:MAG TPA: cystathionine beta-lyase [Gammaproteobacteria bacterium]|nr:cystathionine beta-lyase [Chromatiales bacterium]MCP4925516.1 cystathionine beta-lyase [Gammaproteobacteria bacterium]HJP39541.1 cystathionine beta-lyase [Gammaproteobacteria bacterium]
MKKQRRVDTTLTHAGRNALASQGAVNIPPFRASTVLFDTISGLRTWDTDFRAFHYGRIGTPGSQALEEAYAELEGADRAIAVSCGLAAINISISAFVQAGDHILVTAGAYDPAITFCRSHLGRFGVEIETYPPEIGANIEALIRPNTRVVYLESPSSMTFEIQDIPAIVSAVAKQSAKPDNRIVTILDNTWATPLNLRPLDLGVDIVVQAATKYLVGHADAMLGIIACSNTDFPAIKSETLYQGVNAGSEEVYLGLRGLRTLSVRMERQFASALKIAQWLQQRPEVARVLFPPLPGAPGHDLWQRDFTGGSSLMGIVLNTGYAVEAVNAMLDGMQLFAMGFSWGGYESLLIGGRPQRGRTPDVYAGFGPAMRLYTGLEDVDELIADLESGFNRLSQFEPGTNAEKDK